MSGFWSGYWQSLKSLDVEEPVDVYVHRPLAYVLARLLLPTPVSPNLVTIASMVVGVYAGVLIPQTSLPHHFQWAALCAFISTVFDCADGQLARMRKTSSVLGRMLDGTADVLVTTAILIGTAFYLVGKYGTTPLNSALAIAFTISGGIFTGVQTSLLFDHYKTLFLKLTVPGFKEAESYPEVKKRYDAQTSFTPVTRLAWFMYLSITSGQYTWVRRFDPHTVSEFSMLGEYEPTRAQIYREQVGPVMASWRRWFGYGSLMMGITLALALEAPEHYIILRFTLYGLVFYGSLMFRQRAASRRAFEAMGVVPR